MDDTVRVRVASFEDLEVFKRAYRLSLDVHRRSLDWPQIEQRALGDQVRRASRSPLSEISPKDTAARNNRKRSSSAFCGWRSVRLTRCESGRAMRWISVISMSRFGGSGETNIRRLRRCCKASWRSHDGLSKWQSSVVRRLSSVL